MKLRIGGLMLVLFSLMLPAAAQGSSNTIDPAYKKIVWKNTTVTLTGPNGNGAPAPTVLQVTGGMGFRGLAGGGGGISLTGGAGGGFHGGGVITLAGGNGIDFGQSQGGAIQLTGGRGSNGSQHSNGGPGGSISIVAGDGGGGSGTNANGGSILLQAGAPGNFGDIPGDVILTGGNVGIGTATPANMLEVVAGGTTLADAWTTRSSRRWKTNIQTLHGALAKVEQLRGVSYDLKANGKHEVGVIAEEVGAVVPEVVSWDKNGKDAQGVDYSRLTALLIEATKEQQREIQHQKAALRMQAAAIRDLKSELRATRQTLQKVKAQVADSQLALVAVK